MKLIIDKTENGYIFTKSYKDVDGDTTIQSVIEADLGNAPESDEDCDKAKRLVYEIIYALDIFNYYFDIEVSGKHAYSSKKDS